MKTRIDMRKTPTGYVLDVAGKFGGGFSEPVGQDIDKAVSRLRFAISRYLDTNDEGGTVNAPKEVTEAMEASAVTVKGKRISYYAVPDAVIAIQQERERTGADMSKAITALVLRGSDVQNRSES